MTEWIRTPPGRYLLAWEQAQCDVLVPDLFGFHALQLGLPDLEALRTNRMQHRWLATSVLQDKAHLACDFCALPFPSGSLDLVVLPHALELAIDPHQTLREVERVLVPEGRVLIFGLNPVSLWGLSQRRAILYRRMGLGRLFLPKAGELIGYWRLRDWLRLLGLEVEQARQGCFRPALGSAHWLERFAWMDRLAEHGWPLPGAVYQITAIKRVRGMTLLSPSWKLARRPASAPVSVAGSAGLTGASGMKDQTLKEL